MVLMLTELQSLGIMFSTLELHVAWFNIHVLCIIVLQALTTIIPNIMLALVHLI